MKRRKKYLQDEVNDNIKLFMKMSHNFENIYCMEDRLINCIKSGNIKSWGKIAKNIITVTLIEEGNRIESIKKKLIQTYYLISRSILDEVLNLKNIKELNENNINKTKHIFDIDEISQWFMDSILCVYNKLHSSKTRFNNITAYKIENYVSSHYKEDISLKFLSEKFDKSYNYLSSVFNKEMKMSFREYLNNYRIKKAEKILIESELTLAEISMEVGFSSQSYFSKVFKNNTGVSPLKYRNIMKKT